MRTTTQKDIVISRLREAGYCDNFWSIENKVSIRLSTIIHSLKKAGWNIQGNFGEGAFKKNFYYHLIAEPANSGEIKEVVCCYSLKEFGVHARDCAVVAPKQEVKKEGMML